MKANVSSSVREKTRSPQRYDNRPDPGSVMISNPGQNALRKVAVTWLPDGPPIATTSSGAFSADSPLRVTTGTVPTRLHASSTCASPIASYVVSKPAGCALSAHGYTGVITETVSVPTSQRNARRRYRLRNQR